MARATKQSHPLARAAGLWPDAASARPQSASAALRQTRRFWPLSWTGIPGVLSLAPNPGGQPGNSVAEAVEIDVRAAWPKAQLYALSGGIAGGASLYVADGTRGVRVQRPDVGARTAGCARVPGFAGTRTPPHRGAHHGGGRPQLGTPGNLELQDRRREGGWAALLLYTVPPLLFTATETFKLATGPRFPVVLGILRTARLSRSTGVIQDAGQLSAGP